MSFMAAVTLAYKGHEFREKKQEVRKSRNGENEESGKTGFSVFPERVVPLKRSDSQYFVA